MPRQWTAEMTQCATCHKNETCLSRAKLIKILSTTTHELIMDETEGGESGVIIVSCRRS